MLRVLGRAACVMAKSIGRVCAHYIPNGVTVKPPVRRQRASVLRHTAVVARSYEGHKRRDPAPG